MSNDAQNLLASFEALPLEEQQVVAAEIVRRAPQPESPLAEDDEIDILPPDEWVPRFRAWARSHKGIRNPNLDDSREAMYEGCGG